MDQIMLKIKHWGSNPGLSHLWAGVRCTMLWVGFSALQISRRHIFGRRWHLVVAKNHVSPLFHLIKTKLGKTAQKKTSWKGWRGCRQGQWFLRSRPGKEAWRMQRHFSGETDQGPIGRAWTCLSRASHTVHTFPPALILQPIRYLPQALPLPRFQSPCKVQPVQRPLQV